MSENALEGLDTQGHAPPLLESMRAAAEEAAELLRSIGSPYRLMILCLLMEREKTVTEICDAIGARQSLTSQHLTRLRLDGLVKAERRGHFAYYSLTDTLAKDIVATLYQHYCAKNPKTSKSSGSN
ncbi:MAG: helix-turn-helix transcriptional regulator [Hyphomicrobiaceae bacterium]|nr:helix-turn-helix transcriptional regulator [Hyphomicrobiaceae bacterium]